MGGGLGSTLMTGMAFGAGSEIAHQAVRGVMGGGSGHGGQVQNEQPMENGQMQAQEQQQQQQYAQPQQNPCTAFNTSFLSCLKQYTNDVSMCQTYMDSLMQCEKDNMRFYGST